MQKKYAVESIGELITAVREIEKELMSSELWFRGHRESDWKLQPTVFRGHEATPDLLERENRLCREFRVQAPARMASAPSHEAHASWLCLMQHHGAKTRLLDWTESVLVSAYFAVINGTDASDAAIWVLDPLGMNYVLNDLGTVLALSDMQSNVLTRSPFLLRDPINDGGGGHQEEEPPGYCAASGIIENPRPMAQMSQFTLHEGPVPLERGRKSREFLRKIAIPGSSRLQLRQDIQLLGVRRSLLFPDLDNLATELNSRFI